MNDIERRKDGCSHSFVDIPTHSSPFTFSFLILFFYQVYYCQLYVLKSIRCVQLFIRSLCSQKPKPPSNTALNFLFSISTYFGQFTNSLFFSELHTFMSEPSNKEIMTQTSGIDELQDPGNDPNRDQKKAKTLEKHIKKSIC